MPNYKNQQELIQSFRNDFPSETYTLTDKQIYERWAIENRSIGRDIPEYVKPTISSVNINNTNFTTPPKKDSSPQDINSLYEMGTSMLTAGVAEFGIDEGMMGVSADFFKKSYNESNAGLLYQALHGKPKYEYSVDDYEVDGWAAEAGSFLLGMLSPLEVGVFATSMGTAGLAAGATRLGIGFLSNLGRKAAVSSVTKGATGLTTHLATNAMSSGFGLGTFGAAHGGLASAADQKIKTGTIDARKVAEDASDAFLESFMIGAPAGLIGRGGLGRFYATKKMAERPLTSIPRLATGLPGQYATEVGAFSALPNLYKAVGLESYKDYPILFSDEWNKTTATNALIIAPFFFQKPLREKLWDLKVKIGEDTKLNIEETNLEREGEALGNTEINSLGFDLGPEFAAKVAEHASIKKSSKSEVARFKVNRKRLEEINEAADGKSDNVIEGDREFVIGRDGIEALAFKKGILEDLVNNPNQLKEVADIIKEKEAIKEKIPFEEANLMEVEALKVEYKDVINIIDAAHSKFTELATGVRKTVEPVEPVVEEVPIKEVPIKEVPKKEVPPVEADITGTPEQVVKFWEDSVASINKSIKIAKSAGEKENLQSQLKGAGFQLSGARKVLKALTVEPTPKVAEELPGTRLTVQKFKRSAQKERADVRKRMVKLANIQELIEAEQPFTKSNQKKAYDFNTEIVVRMLQRLPKKRGKLGAAGGYVADYVKRANDMQKFSKHVVEKGFSFKNVPDEVFIEYVQKYPSTATQLGVLVDKLKLTYKNRQLMIEGSELSGEAGEAPPPIPGGALIQLPSEAAKFYTSSKFPKAINIGKDSITMVYGKQLKKGMQTKPLSIKTAKILKELQKKQEKTLSKHLFPDKEGYSLGSLELKALVEKVAGVKPKAVQNSPPRAFRKSMTTWASEKFGPGSKEYSVVELEILKDFSNLTKIQASYDVAKFGPLAKKLQKQYLSAISKAKGTKKGEQYYTVQEIKKALEYDFTQDIDIKVPATKTVKGKKIDIMKTRTISGDVAEGAIRLLIETGPRINEIVSQRRRPSGEFQRQPVGAPASVEEMKRILEEARGKNPGVKIKTIKDADYAGKFEDGVIYITLGKANKKTWYHENAHELEKMVYTMGDKELIRVFEAGKKLFAKDANNAEKPISEFIPDELMNWAAGQSRSKTIAQKMKNWTDRLWSKITKLFFGKQHLTKYDVRNILGEKVYKGFERIPEYRERLKLGEKGMPQYQFENVIERAKSAKKDFDFAVKEAGGVSRGARASLIEHIATLARIEKPKEFNLNSKDVIESDVIKFKQTLDEIPFEDMARVANMADAYKTVEYIRGIETDFIDRKTRNKMFEFFGIRANNLYQLAKNRNELNKYKDFLLKTKYPGTKDNAAYLIESVVQSERNLPQEMTAEFEKPGNFKRFALRGIYTGHGYVGSVGFKSLETKLLKHASTELGHVARFTEGFEANVKKLLGSKWERIFGAKIQTTLDKQRLLERLDLNILTDSEKSFVKTVYRKDAIQTKDGKHIINPKYTTLRQSIKDRPKNPKDSPLLEATYEYIDYVDYAPSEFNGITEKFFKTESEHADYLKSKPISFLSKDIYVRRQLTNDARKFIKKLGTYKDKFIDGESLRIQEKMAIEKYGTKASAEKMVEFEDIAFEKADRLFNNMLEYNQSLKISDSFFKGRKDKVPEFITFEGKKIEMYESKYEATKSYGLGVAKALATIEYFPDIYDVTRKFGAKHAGTEKMLNELVDKSPEHGHIVKHIVDRQLGEYQTRDALVNDIGAAMNQASSIFAKTALSFPTSGWVKNLGLGQAQTVGFTRLSDYFGSMIDVMDAGFRRDLRMTGQQEVGLRHISDISPKLAPKFWDLFFKLGGMRPSENINRYISSASGIRYANREVDALHYKNFSEKRKYKARGRLKDKFFLDDAQVDLKAKYGNNGVTGHELSSFEKRKVIRELRNIDQQIATYAHINTQGATTALFQPIWASGPLAKPLTLFKRMAFSASDNILRNIKTAYKYGEYGRLVTIGLAPIGVGYYISAVNNYVLGTPMPKENSNHAEWVKYLAIKGEGLGAATDILKFMEGEGADNTIYPALYSWLLAFIDAVRAPIQGKKTVKQSGEDFLKATLSAYRNSIKTYENMKNPFKIGYKKYRTLKYDFIEEMYPKKQKPTGYSGRDLDNLGTRSDVYRDFETVFMSGDVDAIAKQYVNAMYVLAADKMRQDTPKGKSYTMKDFNYYAYKYAIPELEKKITAYHPNPYEPDKKYTPKNEKVMLEWYNWLAKDPERAKTYAKELETLTEQYRTKIMGLNNHIDKYMGDEELMKQIKKSVRRHLKSSSIVLY